MGGLLGGFSSYSKYNIGGTLPKLTNSCGARRVVNTDRGSLNCTRFRAVWLNLQAQGPYGLATAVLLWTELFIVLLANECKVWQFRVLKALHCIKETEILFLRTELIFRIISF